MNWASNEVPKESEPMGAPARDDTYNYPRFKMSNYELGYFPGPKAGEE